MVAPAKNEMSSAEKKLVESVLELSVFHHEINNEEGKSDVVKFLEQHVLLRMSSLCDGKLTPHNIDKFYHHLEEKHGSLSKALIVATGAAVHLIEKYEVDCCAVLGKLILKRMKND